MSEPVAIDGFLADGRTLIDVRSPGEFKRGHIPSAFNLPLLLDEQRARVGTLYKQQGRQAATQEALHLVAPRLPTIVAEALRVATTPQVGLYCWRGGQRSGSMAWLLETVAAMRVCTLRNGYKAYRNQVLQTFTKPWKLRVLGGYTGSGKTGILEILQHTGHQTIDLEAIANHRGSAFGGIGQPEQPTTEHFENLMADALNQMDPQRPIWIEDESQNLGKVKINDAFFAQMRSGPVWFVQASMEQRVARLVNEYGTLPAHELAEAIDRISKRLGPQHALRAKVELQRGNLPEVVAIALGYYDKRYRRGLDERDPRMVHRIPAEGLTPKEVVERLP